MEEMNKQWAVYIKGDPHPACVWANNRTEAIEASRDLFYPINIDDKIEKVCLTVDGMEL